MIEKIPTNEEIPKIAGAETAPSVHEGLEKIENIDEEAKSEIERKISKLPEGKERDGIRYTALKKLANLKTAALLAMGISAATPAFASETETTGISTEPKAEDIVVVPKAEAIKVPEALSANAEATKVAEAEAAPANAEPVVNNGETVGTVSVDVSEIQSGEKPTEEKINSEEKPTEEGLKIGEKIDDGLKVANVAEKLGAKLPKSVGIVGDLKNVYDSLDAASEAKESIAKLGADGDKINNEIKLLNEAGNLSEENNQRLAKLNDELTELEAQKKSLEESVGNNQRDAAITTATAVSNEAAKAIVPIMTVAGVVSDIREDNQKERGAGAIVLSAIKPFVSVPTLGLGGLAVEWVKDKFFPRKSPQNKEGDNVNDTSSVNTQVAVDKITPQALDTTK